MIYMLKPPRNASDIVQPARNSSLLSWIGGVGITFLPDHSNKRTQHSHGNQPSSHAQRWSRHENRCHSSRGTHRGGVIVSAHCNIVTYLSYLTFLSHFQQKILTFGIVNRLTRCCLNFYGGGPHSQVMETRFPFALAILLATSL